MLEAVTTVQSFSFLFQVKCECPGCLNVIHKNQEYLTNEVTWLSLDIGFSITLVQILPAISLCRLAHTDTALANGLPIAGLITSNVKHLPFYL